MTNNNDDDIFFPDPEIKTAKRYMFWLARIFGKRIDSDGCFYYWRGKIYVVKLPPDTRSTT